MKSTRVTTGAGAGPIVVRGKTLICLSIVAEANLTVINVIFTSPAGRAGRGAGAARKCARLAYVKQHNIENFQNPPINETGAGAGDATYDRFGDAISAAVDRSCITMRFDLPLRLQPLVLTLKRSEMRHDVSVPLFVLQTRGIFENIYERSFNQLPSSQIRFPRGSLNCFWREEPQPSTVTAGTSEGGLAGVPTGGVRREIIFLCVCRLGGGWWMACISYARSSMGYDECFGCGAVGANAPRIRHAASRPVSPRRRKILRQTDNVSGILECAEYSVKSSSVEYTTEGRSEGVILNVPLQF
ncbi:hypothetical protein EVAR_51578_1 [Eumeta japonica]|uniref:Uncharacterized protein n=1 Tax=Eumeta variegata TaxID=151549 RepID=A0A4C1YH69_EUMVA|nr:hypothetical protein EVAR_51578_1 [Eumeta japonica]